MNIVKTIQINRWNGRLGNNIIQLINVIQISLYYKYNIDIPNHSFFKYNKEGKGIKKLPMNIVKDNSDFFYIDKILNLDKEAFNCNINESVQILKNIFTIKNNMLLKKNKMLIHIRSGDIFCSNHPHKDYINPPYYYYKKIIDENDVENIILIAEDRKNPVINKLLNNYPNIIFKQQRLEEDIKLLLESEIVIMSFGTFVPSLLILSDNIKKIYKPSYQSFDYYYKFFNNIEIIDIHLDEYRALQHPWKNTENQKRLLLNYKIE